MHTKDAVLKASLFQFFDLYFFNFEFKIFMYLHIYFMFHPYAIGHNSKNSLNLFLHLIFLFQACFNSSVTWPTLTGIRHSTPRTDQHMGSECPTLED